MVTRKLLMPSALVAVLSAGLLGEQASATEEFVVLGTQAAVVDEQALRLQIDSYMRAVNEQLRTTLDQDLKRVLAPEIELASNELRARG